MSRRVERCLKIAGFSVCALAGCACARLAPFDLSARRPEPRFAEPPIALKAEHRAVAVVRDDQMTALEAEMDALIADAADLQLAIKVMGPLPDPGAGSVHAAFPDAAKPLPQRTFYRQVSEPTVIPKSAAVLFPASGDTRLVASALPGEGAHGALCVELSALAGRCRPVVPIRAYR